MYIQYFAGMAPHFLTLINIVSIVGNTHMFSYYAWLYTLKTPISLLLKLGTTKSSHFLTKVGQLWATNAA